MKRLSSIAIVTALASIAFLQPTEGRRLAAGDEEKRTATWRYEGGTLEVSLIVPTPFDNVKADIPPVHWDHIIRADVNGTEMAFLIFDLKRAPRTILTTKGKEHCHDNLIELVIAVLYASGNPEDSGELFQFYTLARLTNFAEMAKAQKHMGLPAEFVEELDYELVVDESGLGMASLNVPWRESPFTVAAEFAWINLDEFDAAAGEFFEGKHGLMKVTHRGKLALNPAQGAFTASDSGDVLAQWMGGPSAAGEGYFVAFNPLNHSLVAEIIWPKK